MKAKEAKALSEENLKSVIIGPYLETLYEKIKVTAQKGEFSITDPFTFGRSPSPSWDAQQEINKVLRANGYEIINHPDPDPGHPCSGGGYTTLSWK